MAHWSPTKLGDNNIEIIESPLVAEMNIDSYYVIDIIGEEPLYTKVEDFDDEVVSIAFKRISYINTISKFGLRIK